MSQLSERQDVKAGGIQGCRSEGTDLQWLLWSNQCIRIVNITVMDTWKAYSEEDKIELWVVTGLENQIRD